MFINRRLARYGLGLWAAGTIALHVAGNRLLPHGSIATVVVLMTTIPAMAWVARRLCQRAGLPPHERAAGALALMLPTLVLDAFTTAFFPAMFPDTAPDAAGIFGGWMLACCAGAALGASVDGGSPRR